MRSELAGLPPEIETIAEMRALYRAAEARAARMRLLYTAGRELAEADASNVTAVLQRCADRLAFFVGRTQARIRSADPGCAIGIHAPGSSGPPLSYLIIADFAGADAIADREDRETFQMYLDLMGATLDRVQREAERAALLGALTDREQRLESLVGRILSAQEEERLRISRDLHDGIAQTATALVRMLEGAQDGAMAALSGEERKRLATIARGLVTELREVIAGLRPALLDDLGLEAALRALADGLEADGYAVQLRLRSGLQRFPAPVETALYRVAQEAVTNIRKHAGGPCAVTMELGTSGDGAVLLRVADTGRGAVGGAARLPSDGGERLGIEGMRERMGALGGGLEWRAGRHGGVCITATVPVPA